MAEEIDLNEDEEAALDRVWEAISAESKANKESTSKQKSRNEYGPRHQPPKRIEGAVARLEALLEFSDDIDDEALENEVKGIAREFDAADFKEIARKFGVKRDASA